MAPLPARRTTPGQLRVGDAERDRAAALLRDAHAEGRLEFGEFEHRLTAAFNARVYDDLDPLLADLPPRGAAPAVDALGAPAFRRSVAIMGGRDREGVWELGATHHVVAMCGGVTLDLRQARFTVPEVLIHATAMWGGVDVIVNPTTRVSVEGGAFLGDFRQARDRAKPRVDTDSPLVRVRGIAVMGGVTVVRKSLPGEAPRRWFGRR